MKRHDSTGKQEPGVSWSKSPGSPTPSLSADQAASSPLFPLNSAELSQGDVSHQEEAASPGAGRVDGLGPKLVDARAKQIDPLPDTCVSRGEVLVLLVGLWLEPGTGDSGSPWQPDAKVGDLRPHLCHPLSSLCQSCFPLPASSTGF